MNRSLLLLSAAAGLAAIASAKTTNVLDSTGILDNGVPRDAVYGSDTNTWDSDLPGGLPYAENYAAHFTPYSHGDPRNGQSAIGALSACYTNGHPFIYANNFSIEAWVKFDQATIDSTSSSVFFHTAYYGFGVQQGGLSPHFTTYGRRDWILLSCHLEKDVWYHLVLTYTGPTANFYVDGQPVGSITDPGQTGARTGTYAYFAIAHFTSSTPDGPTYNPYFGWIDELAVFPHILSDEQVLAHYNAGNGNYSAAVHADKPSGYWNFNMKRSPRILGAMVVVR